MNFFISIPYFVDIVMAKTIFIKSYQITPLRLLLNTFTIHLWITIRLWIMSSAEPQMHKSYEYDHVIFPYVNI